MKPPNHGLRVRVTTLLAEGPTEGFLLYTNQDAGWNSPDILGWGVWRCLLRVPNGGPYRSLVNVWSTDRIEVLY